MKTRGRFIKALLIVLPLVGICLAWITYQYEVLVRFVIGSAVIYLLTYYLKFSKTDLSLNEMAADAKIYHHHIFVFIGPVIAFWAFAEGLDSISLLTKSLLDFMK